MEIEKIYAARLRRERRVAIARALEKISRANGGDDPDWLRSYIDQTLKVWDDRLVEAMDCFTAELTRIERTGSGYGYQQPLAKARQEGKR